MDDEEISCPRCEFVVKVPIDTEVVVCPQCQNVIEVNQE